MPVGERQKLITQIAASVLGSEPVPRPEFGWLINRHTEDSLGEYFSIVETLFLQLGGDSKGLLNKSVRQLAPDAYFGGSFQFILEFDEVQHFSTARLATLDAYPKDIRLGFKPEDYRRLCSIHSGAADKYRMTKSVPEFPHVGGRTKQRALFDCIRDFAAINNGLNPIVRISEFDVIGISENNQIARERIKCLLEQGGVQRPVSPKEAL